MCSESLGPAFFPLVSYALVHFSGLAYEWRVGYWLGSKVAARLDLMSLAKWDPKSFPSFFFGARGVTLVNRVRCKKSSHVACGCKHLSNTVLSVCAQIAREDLGMWRKTGTEMVVMVRSLE